MAVFNLNTKMDEKLFQSFGGTTSLAYADDLHSKGLYQGLSLKFRDGGSFAALRAADLKGVLTR